MLYEPLNLIEALERFEKVRLPKWKKGKYLTIEYDELCLYISNKMVKIKHFKKSALFSREWSEYQE